jgi:hypothetical protein
MYESLPSWKKRLHSLCWVLFFKFASIVALHAQPINNVKATLNNDLIIITYNLNTPEPDAVYEVKIYTSFDNFTYPLNLVAGDVGPNVKPGFGKRVEWRAKQELGQFKGEIQFEIRATKVAAGFAQLKLLSPSGGKVKMGKRATIRWEGGNPNDQVEISLYKGNTFDTRIASTNNNGAYSWNVPKGKKGEGYKIQLTAGNSRVSSEHFSIVKPPPILAIAGSGLLLGGVVVAVMMLGGDEEPQGGDLPVPPGLPSN